LSHPRKGIPRNWKVSELAGKQAPINLLPWKQDLF